MKKQYRKQILLKENELTLWGSHFSLYGTKSELENETNISRVTLSRILANGRGDEQLVKKIRAFMTNVNV